MVHFYSFFYSVFADLCFLLMPINTGTYVGMNVAIPIYFCFIILFIILYGLKKYVF